MQMRRMAAVAAVWFGVLAARGEDQVWTDGTLDKVWSTNAANWEGGALWTNGNSAVFSGGAGTLFGETVDVGSTVVVANVTFLTNGYVLADADADGSLSVAGAPSVFTVMNAGDTARVSEVVAGFGGFTKAGPGQLQLTTNNAFSGTATVGAGVLRLARGNLMALGAAGVGHETVVAAGATLDFNGCYVNSGTSERFTIAGAGADGKGALVNTGADMVNRDLASVTLQDDATVGGSGRMDFASVTGNGKTFTKTGTHQLCVKNLANASIVINQGQYTLLGDWRALGGSTAGDTVVNGGSLNAWNSMTVPERITFNGGAISQGNPNLQLFNLSGYLTVNSNVNFNSSSITNGVEISGYVDGPGGFTQTTASWCYFTCDTNAYTGPTTVNGGCPLYVGKTNLYSGVLGFGTVTNNGSLYGYSSRICQGRLVNAGNLYLATGILTTAGSVVNNGSLYLDRGGAFTLANAFSGGGTVYLRHNPDVTFDGSASTNSGLRAGAGSFTLANNAYFRFTGEIQVADRFVFALPDPGNVTCIINVQTGCTLVAQAITFGNGTNVVNGGMTSVVNHAGAVVTTGRAAEDNGIRLGHYPQAYSVYNMMAGTLTVGADYDLSCATDGNGWFKMTGGEVYAKRVMLNERDGTGGYGRLTVSGGTLNVGSLTGSTLALSNAVCADLNAPYLVELGGGGGTLRAVTNLWVPARATLFGSGAEAITFDTREWAISVTNTLSGAGGLNKAGSGTLLLSGKNSFTGLAHIAEGTLLLGDAGAVSNVPLSVAAGATVDLGGLAVSVASVTGAGAVSNGSLKVAGTIAPGTNGIGTLTFALASAAPGGTLVVDVSTNGTCDVLQAAGDLDLSGMMLELADPEQLAPHQDYTVITFSGTLTGALPAVNLPSRWYVMHDRVNQRVVLSSKNGTLLRVK